jgi:hypothetical protein
MDMSFSSAVVVLLLVVDPIGNIPIFVSLLRQVDPARRMRVVLRECAIAYGVLIGCVFAGGAVLRLFGLSDTSLTIAGGVILFLIALRMGSGARRSCPNLPAGSRSSCRPRSCRSWPTAIATVVRSPRRARRYRSGGAVTVAGGERGGCSPPTDRARRRRARPAALSARRPV